MNCPECNRLTVEYQRIGRRYASAVHLLNASIAGADVREYMKLRAAAHEARVDAETVRRELEKHTEIHRKTN
jgi:hypothetical protein